MSKSYNTVSETKLDCLWIHFPNSIDMDNYKDVESDILKKIEISDLSQVVLDLSKVTVIFSSGLGTLMRIHSSSEKQGKTMSLVNVTKRVQEGFDTTGLNRIFNIHTTEEDFSRSLKD